ncbi:MAG: FecR family protein [Bacteroidetes bacterium]|nr:FecR family protein [Bacteroidota bacterium]
MNKQENTEYWERMTKYFSNELNKDEKSMFEEWAQKVDNQDLLNQMKRDFEKIDDTKYVFEKSTDQAWGELYSKIQLDDIKVSTKNKYTINFRIFYQAAAALIIVFGLSWALIHLTKGNSQKIITTEYSQSEITLSDGSIVFLNANSKLIYPEKFEGNNRTVELIGEGFFEITPNPEKPFIITANDAEIKVLGTKFNVFAYKNISKVEVLVESGIVSLSSKSEPKNALLLEKGEFGFLSDNILQESLVPTPNYLSWITKVMDFRNEDLVSVLEVINHTYGANIKLEGEPLKELKLTSKYDNIHLDTLLQSICIAFNLEKSEINNQIILANK